MRVPFGLSGLVALMLISAAPDARAEPSSQDRALAESLFREAKSLAKDGDFERACPKFAESQRLDPQLGTLLHLATCHEGQGKTASAWVEFSEAGELAARRGEADREQLARRRVAALEPRLARLRVAVEDAPPGLVLALDGRELGDAALATTIPVDAGEHELTARAPGHVGTTRHVQVPSEPGVIDVVLSPLARHAEDGSSSDELARASDDGRAERLTGYIALTVGGASMAVGGVLGILAIAARAEADRACDGRFCSADGLDMHDRARAYATGSTATFFAGLGVLGLGVVMVVLGQPSSPGSSAWWIGPALGSDTALAAAGVRW